MGQRVFVKGRIYDSDDPVLQTVLADIHDSPERPRCMCVEAGVDLYISRRPSGYCLARMPGTGGQHHPTCPDYEPNPGMSGRGMLMGEAIIERSPEVLEIHIGFALSRGAGRAIPRGEQSPPKDVPAPKQRMSLQAVMHMLYESARFNRWYPSMAGMRSQGVLCKYLMEAAGNIVVRGEPLAKRLYVPEPFSVDRKEEIADRRRQKLAFLHGTDDANEHPFAFVIGEFKEVQDAAGERKVIVKHMPDAPLYTQSKAWERVERVYKTCFEARDADVANKPRILLMALISAKRESIYQVERLNMMMVSDEYIPINGAFELPLLARLRAENRIFLKPMQYDAPSAAAFPNFILFDARTAEGADYPLFVSSSFESDKDKALKAKALAAIGAGAWVWETGSGIPQLPPPRRYSPNQAREEMDRRSAGPTDSERSPI